MTCFTTTLTAASHAAEQVRSGGCSRVVDGAPALAPSPLPPSTPFLSSPSLLSRSLPSPPFSLLLQTCVRFIVGFPFLLLLFLHFLLACLSCFFHFLLTVSFIFIYLFMSSPLLLPRALSPPSLPLRSPLSPASNLAQRAMLEPATCIFINFSRAQRWPRFSPR